MTIDRINLSMKGIAPIKQPSIAEGTKPAASDGTDFGKMFADAIKEVDQMQVQADGQIDALVTGKPGATPHDAMLALEKADIAFQLMNQIRGKIIRAYEEVMRTQV